MGSKVFRQASLDRLASPEQLDQLLQVTRLRGWIALAALAVLVTTALTWGVTSTVPFKVGGQGILLRSGGVFEIVPLASGRVADIAVSVGDAVREGQVVARIAQPDLSEKIKQARLLIANRRAEIDQHETYGTKELRLQTAYLDQQQESLSAAIAADQEAARWLQEKIASQQQLVDQGRLTRQTLVATRQQLDTVAEQIRASEGQLAQLSIRRLELQVQQEKQGQVASFNLAAALAELSQLEQSLKSSTEIASPYSGRIIEIMAEQGNVVAPGEPIIRLDLSGRAVKELEAVVYVPSEHGKRVQLGMEIEIAPATVKPEEFGYMRGKVTYVSDFPTTGRGMQRVLKNPELVMALSRGDAPYEIHADLIPDAATVSRYRWSSSQGPPVRILSGTLCQAMVIVESRRPIQMVMPFLREQLGV